MKRIMFISVMMIAVILATHQTYIKGAEYRDSVSKQVTYPVKEFEGDYEKFLNDIYEERENHDVKSESSSKGDERETADAVRNDKHKIRYDIESFDVELRGDREVEQTIEETEQSSGNAYDGYSEIEDGVEGASDEVGESWIESSWDNDYAGTDVGYSSYTSEQDDDWGSAELDAGWNNDSNEYGWSEDDSVYTYLGEWTSTAYCACELCCGQWASGYTASGTLATEGRTVACGAFPFGTQLMIDGHIYTVEDRGVDGEWVDIFFYDHAAASAYGMRTVSVYLVG